MSRAYIVSRSKVTVKWPRESQRRDRQVNVRFSTQRVTTKEILLATSVKKDITMSGGMLREKLTLNGLN